MYKESQKFKRLPILIPWSIYNGLIKLVKKKTGNDKLGPYIVELIIKAIEEDEKSRPD